MGETYPEREVKALACTHLPMVVRSADAKSERLLLKLPEITQEQAEQLEMPELIELFTMLLPSVNMEKNFLSKWRRAK